MLYVVFTTEEWSNTHSSSLAMKLSVPVLGTHQLSVYHINVLIAFDFTVILSKLKKVYQVQTNKHLLENHNTVYSLKLNCFEM